MSSVGDRGWWLSGRAADGREVKSTAVSSPMFPAVWRDGRRAELLDGRVVEVAAGPRVEPQEGAVVFLLHIGVRWVFAGRNDWA